MNIRSSELLKKYDLKLKKSLGQNLLLDPNINRKMAEIAEVGPDDSVFEVGAGIGDLTQVLAEKAREVLAVEIDERFERPLEDRFEDNPKVRLFIGDILNHTVEQMVQEFLPEAETLKMVSNLPFYITSPILRHFLESEIEFVSLTVMVQREVAGRIVAEPGGKDYGLLGIACQLYTQPYVAHFVSASCFRPKPKVESAIVHLPRRKTIPIDGETRRLFFQIVGTAFGQRRKKLINSLNPLCGNVLPGKKALRKLLEHCDIGPDARAETISIDSFIKFAVLVSQHSDPG